MTMIQNPVLRGFNPDPSIVRVGDDYYIATSTFEWFPGINLHHSKDLVNWRQVGHVLKTTEHLDMRGMDNSEGVYAPNLTYADGKFWAVFSNVHSCRGESWMGTPCYVVTAESIEGPWSKPVPLGNYCFDPSLFHDDDGRKYMLNAIWDGRLGRNFFGGIVLQEFDAEQGKLVGELHNIFPGTELGCTEGPQLMKKDGWYYLITAEGGTGFDHAVTVCRSRSITGPYEVHPENPMLTSYLKADAPLQRAGHGYFVETQNGEWYLSHLCGRPIKNPEGYQYIPSYGNGFCTLGRESALQQISWQDDWPYLTCGGNTPQLEVPAPEIPAHPWPALAEVDHFEGDSLGVQYQTLREPAEASWCQLTGEGLRLTGRQYLYSRYEQSLVARRIQSHRMEATTCLVFKPDHHMQMAGLVAYYSRENYYFCKLTVNDAGEPVLSIAQHISDQYGEPVSEQALPLDCQRLELKLTLDSQWYQFSYSLDGQTWQDIGRRLNSTPLSDEGGKDVFAFTGSFVGMAACDLTGNGKTALFEYFGYKEL